MGLFTPKYPPGAEPTKKESRRDARKAREETRGTVTEADLRSWERSGWIVRRGAEYVVVEREQSGSYEMCSFTVLGNGRYGRR